MNRAEPPVVTLLPFNLERLDVNFEAEMERPIFDFGRQLPEVAEAIYGALEAIDPSPRIGPGDIQGLPATTYADPMLKMRMYGGAFTVEAGANRLSASLQGLKIESDLTIARKVLEAVTSTIGHSFPESRIRTTAFRTGSWLQVEGRRPAAERLLREVARPAVAIEPDQIGASRIVYAYRGTIANDRDGWSTVVTLDQSAVASADLFWAFELRFQRNERFASLTSQIDFGRELYLKCLLSIGLQLQQ
jgi:hypothetical protein